MGDKVKKFPLQRLAMDGPKSLLSFLAANVKRETCQGPILLCSGIKITSHSGENMLVVSAKVG